MTPEHNHNNFDLDDLYARLLSGGMISLDERQWLAACASLWVMTTDTERDSFLNRYFSTVGGQTYPSIKRH